MPILAITHRIEILQSAMCEQASSSTGLSSQESMNHSTHRFGIFSVCPIRSGSRSFIRTPTYICTYMLPVTTRHGGGIQYEFFISNPYLSTVSTHSSHLRFCQSRIHKYMHACSPPTLHWVSR